jgi:putative transposase
MARPAVKRQAVAYVVGHYATSRRRACRVVYQHRSVQYYRSRKAPKTALRLRMRELAQVRIRYGYRRLHVLPRREGWSMDFVADQPVNGTRFRALTVIDVYTREALDIVV